MPETGPSPIVLIGMMGSGKSTIGRLLAREAGLDFVDSDRELEQRSGAAIATIFDLEGEEGFRKREAAMLDELTQRRALVLATGGGAVLSQENRDRMRARGLVIHLEAPLEELRRRLSHDKTRPLLQGVDIDARVAGLLSERSPLYQECAHLSFVSGAASPKRMVKRILATPQVIAHLARSAQQ